MKKLLKYMIIIIIVIIIIIIASLLYVMQRRKNDVAENTGEDQLPDEPTLTAVEPSSNAYTYLYSQDLIDKFLEYLDGTEEGINYSEAILAILEENYIKANNLTESNVLTVFANYKGTNSYSIKEIYSQDIGYGQDSIGQYIYTKGIIRKNKTEQYLYVLITEDYNNGAFCLKIITESEYNKIKYGETNNSTSLNIALNDYNASYNKSISDYQICLNYFRDYINTLTNNPEYGYKLLDEEYSKAKFENLSEYLSYVENLGDLSSLVLRKYSITEKDDYTEYIGIDQEGHYYIFKVKSGMEYTIILDTYTIDLPEVVEKYNESTTQEKVVINIDKFMKALNDGDYKYAYSVLADSFKQNNFQTFASFETYAKQTFYELNNFEYVEFGNTSGSYYTYEVKITDSTGLSSDNGITKTFIMQLNEGTDFVMSFNV